MPDALTDPFVQRAIGGVPDPGGDGPVGEGADWDGPVRDAEGDAERCAEALDLMLIATGRASDRAAAKRAAGEAVRAVPGDPRRVWWRWVREAARALDVPVRLVDVTPAEAETLRHDGAALLTFLSDGGDAGGGAADGGDAGAGDGGDAWWAASGPRVRRAGGGETLRRSGRQFRAALNRHVRASDAGADAGAAGTVRVVVAGRAEADLSLHGAGPHAAGPQGAGKGAVFHPSPFAALRSLFRPEWRDVRNIAVFALFVALLNLATPIAVESLVGTVAFGRLLQPVVVLATILLAFLTFQAALRLLQVWVAELIQRRTYVRVASDLARRLPRVTGDGMAGHSGPELVNRFFDVVTVQKVAAGLLLDGLNLVLGAIIGLGILAFYHPFLLGFDLVLLSLMTIVTYLLGRGAVKTAVYESKQKYRMAAWLEDLAANPLTFRHAGGPAFAVDRADRLTADYLEARRKHFRVLVRQVAFALGLQAVAATALLSLGGWLVINRQLTLGQLVAAELIVTLVLSSFAKMGKHLEAWYDLAAAGDKLGVLFALPVERSDGALTATGAVPRAVSREGGGGGNAPAGARLELDGVRVRGGGPFTLAVAPGECVGLSAPGGGGKTALAETLFGRRAALSGRLTLDGLPPRDFRPDALRRHVALAGAAAGGGVEVFAGTIAENVHLERPRVTSADVRAALGRVGLADLIDRLPAGVDTPLTAGGTPLGETDARRLVLARALAGGPRLLVIDSLLDGFPATAAAELLAAIRGPYSILVLSRRPDLLAACDRAVGADGEPIATS